MATDAPTAMSFSLRPPEWMADLALKLGDAMPGRFDIEPRPDSSAFAIWCARCGHFFGQIPSMVAEEIAADPAPYFDASFPPCPNGVHT